MKIRTAQLALALTASLGASVVSAEPPAHWRALGERDLREQLALSPLPGPARNIVLFVGDGMGITTVTAARILEGQQRGETGEENSLYFETLPYLSLMKTYNTNQQTPDSAGTMTAMMSGVKTRAGVIGLDDAAIRGDCASAQGREVTSFLEEAERAGRATGVVTTTRITHATPAAAYAHAPERDWEDDSRIPESQRKAGCRDIAHQLVHFPHGDGIEVAMGGGRRHFLPARVEGEGGRVAQPGVPDPEDRDDYGDRIDGRHLGREWVERFGPDSAWIWSQAQFDALDPATTTHVLATFNESHMQYEHDRAADAAEPSSNPDEAGEPSLSEMTRKAIEILKKEPKGFLLIVEGGRIDHGHHATNAYRALTDTIELARAVEIADALTDDHDTLIVVTADHGHVFTLGGYPTRGNPILGYTVDNDQRGEPRQGPSMAADNEPYTTVGYTSGRGGRVLAPAVTGDGGERIYRESVVEGRNVADESNDPTSASFHQEALVPLRAETHSAEDVALYAKGPGAHLFQRTHEQSYVYYVMKHAAALDGR